MVAEYKGLKIPASRPNATTRDIINALARILPAGSKQAEKFTFLTKTGDPVSDARQVANYVRQNFTYVKDGYTEQNIKTPGALIATKTGDCKTFALFIASVLSAWKYKNGLRFAGYNGSTQPTHVYNFVLDDKNILHTFDSCLPGLKESQNATLIEDMQVNHIAGVPVLNEIPTGIYGRAERRERRQERRERRQERREERKERREERRAEGKGFGQQAKKIALAPGRGAFLLILKANFRGLATRLAKAPAEKLAGFWGKLGGDKNKLMAAINDGKSKKPLLGMGEVDGTPVYQIEYKPGLKYSGARAERIERRRNRQRARGDQYQRPKFYIGDPVTAAAATSAPIIIAAVKFIKDLGIDPGDVVEAVKKIAPGAEPLGNFEATDPETTEAAALTKVTPGEMETETATGTGFKINPLLIVGVAGAAFLLMKKKKGKK